MDEERKPLPNYKVLRGSTKDGKAMILKVDPKLQTTLSEAYRRVKKLNWDYVCIVSGLSGAGKSTFAQTSARYLCKWFDKKYIAFTDDEFISITNNAPEFSAVVLDESFQSLNTRVSMSGSFLRIVNHLQIIRQKHLFIILCLPNFFDLSKGVAIFRSSHLFVTYPDEEGNRGRFLAFDRDAKRNLYIKGSKYMNYNATKANYYAQFWKNGVVDEKVYDDMKRVHLESQELDPRTSLPRDSRNKLIFHLKDSENWKTKKISEIAGLTERTVQLIIKTIRDQKNRKARL